MTVARIEGRGSVVQSIYCAAEKVWEIPTLEQMRTFFLTGSVPAMEQHSDGDPYRGCTVSRHHTADG